MRPDRSITSESLLLRHLDTRRFRLALPRAITLQTLHPAIAASFEEHVAGGLWAHKQRAIGALIQMAYRDEDAQWIIRFAHEHVKGETADGARYHALNPDLFHFQHATYVETLMASIDTYAAPLGDDDRERLYQECRRWYRLYGISERPVPATWAEFVDYFAEACAGLRLTPAGERLAAKAIAPPRWAFGTVPSFAARGIQHDRARDLLRLQTGRAEAIAYETFAAALRSRFPR